MLSGTLRKAVTSKAITRAVCVTPYVVQRSLSNDLSHVKTAQAFENISGKYCFIFAVL